MPAWKAKSYLDCMLKLARLLGIETMPDVQDRRAARLAAAVRKPLIGQRGLAEDFFAPLIAAAVYEPDPSFTRWFVEPALYAFGRRRVRLALLEYLKKGSDVERAGSARAWYWTHLPIRREGSSQETPGELHEAEIDASADVLTEWRNFALREFVGNENPSVRYCLLRVLPLQTPEEFAPELRELVGIATTIAKSVT